MDLKPATWIAFLYKSLWPSQSSILARLQDRMTKKQVYLSLGSLPSMTSYFPTTHIKKHSRTAFCMMLHLPNQKARSAFGKPDIVMIIIIDYYL